MKKAVETSSKVVEAAPATGLRERIKSAETADEVMALLKEGESFVFVSPKTRRAWKRTANVVLKSLKAETVREEVAAVKEVKVKVKANTKKKRKKAESEVSA
jgi:hypothetical protein